MIRPIHALREKKELDALKTRFFKACFFKGLSQTEQEKVLWLNFNQISSVITCVCMLASLAGYGERGEVVEIQWYPGHMARAKRELREILPLLDLIIEVTDARLPFSGRNPELSALLGKKPRILLLNKADLADPEVTAAWVKQYRSQGEAVLEFNARRGENLSQLENLIKREGEKILKQKPTLRLGVVGVPNCGKSSVLNRFVRRSAARVGEKPGVTRGRQWVKRGKWEILDTPGLLWPKIENRETGLKMALIGLIKPDLLDIEGLVLYFLQWMEEYYPAALRAAYALGQEDDPLTMLTAIGQNRGCLRKGGEIDLLRTANLVWSDFRAGRLGRLSLERP